MFYVILFLLSLVLTYTIKWYATKENILDIPNARSSHTQPTPRGGGLAVMIVLYLGMLYLYTQERIDVELLYALLYAIPIILVGLVDDVIKIRSSIRLIIQALCALFALIMLGGVTSIDLIFVTVEGWWLNIIAWLTIVWFTNLYNFLDGIDGYAGAQTLIMGLGLFLLFGDTIGLILFASTLGFFLFNVSFSYGNIDRKSQIFMGDVGSAPLGFIVALIGFSHINIGETPYGWLILSSLFWFDATLTLLRRWKRGESLTKAHKNHAYQRLVQSGWMHSKVTLCFTLINASFIALLFFIPSYYYDYLFLGILFFLMVLYYRIEKQKAFD